MHEQAALDFHPQDRLQAAGGVRQLAPTDIGIERRIDRALNDLGDVSFHVFSLVFGNPDGLPRLPGDAEHQHSAARVRERGQLVGQLVPVRLRDLPAGERHLPAPGGAVLAQPNPPQEPFG